MEFLAIDCETTGLHPYKDDYAIGMAVASDTTELYLTNPADIRFFFDSEDIPIFMHNAKFDMAFLEKMGVPVEKLNIICTVALSRIVYNNEYSLELANMATKVGYKKSDAVKKYCDKNKLFETVLRPGKTKKEKNYFYHKVPLEVIEQYAKLDAKITLELGKHLMDKLTKELFPVYENEKKLTKVFYRMEKLGITIDPLLLKKAWDKEKAIYAACARKFKKISSIDFVDSNKVLSQVFSNSKVSRTKKGRPSFTDDNLAKIDSPLSKYVQDYRKAYKRAGTYESISYYATNSEGTYILNANARQAGCVTGRVSYTNPPLQCLEKPDKDAVIDGSSTGIRRIFIPRPGYKFFMFDYDQFEYRMMVNYAGEEALIEKINNGLDVHMATAEMLGCERPMAKCIAEGSLVLTDSGEIPIEEITLGHKIWDGEHFCNHSGIIYQGIQEVIEYDGITATPDHKVYTQIGEIHELQYCKKYRIPLMVTGFKGSTIWFSANNNRSNYSRQTSYSYCYLQKMWQKVYYTYLKFMEKKDKELPLSKKCKVPNKGRSYPIRKISSMFSKMQQSQITLLEKLWRKRNKIRDILRRLHGFFPRELYTFGNIEWSNRSNKQYGELFFNKYEINIPKTKFKEYQEKCIPRLQRKKSLCYGIMGTFNKGLSLLSTSSLRSNKEYKKGKKLEGNIAYTAKVYDIQNVGNNFRFTVNGRCVKNCINFMLLYGGGSDKLANALNLPLNTAKFLRNDYFKKLPAISKFINNTQLEGRKGVISNWFGRRYIIDQGFEYKAVNYLIQGGCADWIKIAMVRIDELLAGKKSNMLLQTHDELLLEIWPSEEDLIPQVKNIMENVSTVSPHGKVPYTVGVEYSCKSLGDKEEYGEKGRDSLSGEGDQTFKEATK